MPTENAWSLNSDGILVIEGKTPDVLLYDYEHKNLSDWYLNSEDIIINGLLGEPISWAPPYPVGKWYLNDDDILTAAGIPDRLPWTKPYPYTMWYIDDTEILLNSALPEPLFFTDGAFKDSVNLKYIKVPPTVTNIGPYSFANTGLTLVQLPTGCIYSETTFPPGCEIQFYDV